MLLSWPFMLLALRCNRKLKAVNSISLLKARSTFLKPPLLKLLPSLLKAKLPPRFPLLLLLLLLLKLDLTSMLRFLQLNKMKLSLPLSMPSCPRLLMTRLPSLDMRHQTTTDLLPSRTRSLVSAAKDLTFSTTVFSNQWTSASSVQIFHLLALQLLLRSLSMVHLLASLARVVPDSFRTVLEDSTLASAPELVAMVDTVFRLQLNLPLLLALLAFKALLASVLSPLLDLQVSQVAFVSPVALTVPWHQVVLLVFADPLVHSALSSLVVLLALADLPVPTVLSSPVAPLILALLVVLWVLYRPVVPLVLAHLVVPSALSNLVAPLVLALLVAPLVLADLPVPLALSSLVVPSVLSSPVALLVLAIPETLTDLRDLLALLPLVVLVVPSDLRLLATHMDLALPLHTVVMAAVASVAMVAPASVVALMASAATVVASLVATAASVAMAVATVVATVVANLVATAVATVADTVADTVVANSVATVPADMVTHAEVMAFPVAMVETVMAAASA